MSNGAGDPLWADRSLHLVGIGGAGMSGLARIAVELGASVSGSDRSPGSTLDELRSLGIAVSEEHSAGSVPEGAEVVYSSAVAADNPERAVAAARGTRELHRSELLAELTRLKPTIAVTGTHGKTTTTAMVVAALRGAGLDPGWAVGATLAGGEPNAGWGTSDVFVVEADESDRSLLALSARTAVVTNLELDHHATYDSIDDLRSTVAAFLRGVENVVICDGEDLEPLVPSGVCSIRYRPVDPSSGPEGASFGWRGRQVELSVPGVHNAFNACGALEAAVLGGADEAGAVSGIESFKGTGRRFELRGHTRSGAIVIDDYAHHPTEVAATIAAARSIDPGRVVAVFQPHLFSRTAAFVGEFGQALAGADLGFVLDIYPAREDGADFPGVDSRLLVDAANAAAGAERFQPAGSVSGAAAIVAARLDEGDICLLMGAGDVNALASELVE